MKINEKIFPFNNYLSNPLKIRESSELLNKSFDNTINIIQEKSKAHDMHISGFKNNMYALTNNPNIMQNNAFISWINMNIKSNIENITDKVVESTEDIIAEFEEFAYKNSDFKIEKEINNIKIKLNDYLNDPKLLLEIDKLNENMKYINKFAFNYNEKELALNTFKNERENILKLFEDGYYNYINIEPKLNEINESTKDVIRKLKEDYGLTFSYADSYVKDKNSQKLNSSIKEFLSEKDDNFNEFKIISKIKFDNMNKTIFVFRDLSIAIKNNEKLSVVEDNAELRESILDILQAELRNEFKKNPYNFKFFSKVIKECDNAELCYAVKSIEKVIGTYTNNSDVLKLNEFNLEKSYQKIKNKTMLNGRKTSMYGVLEGLDDEMAAIIRSHKIKQYAHSIASNKYKHLYNEESYKQIEEIYNIYEGSDVLQNYIGKKIAIFKTSEDFNDALKSFLKEMNNFSPENILNKAENFGARVIHNEDNQVILEIADYKQAKALGSPSWCIVRDEYYFDSYTKDCKQYFSYDFNLESSDVSSLVGITLNDKGQTTAAHYKDDEEIEDGCNLLIKLENNINDRKNSLETKVASQKQIQQSLF